MEIPHSTSLSNSSYARENISYPQTRNGFTTARDGSLIPEYEASGFMKPQNGAELYSVIDGKETLVGVYGDRLERFTKVQN
ncbi:hypothetical protein [Terribacillus saccharophilus]|nr:hypothetical protein [Terribacillus saccharophilus]